VAFRVHPITDRDADMCRCAAAKSMALGAGIRIEPGALGTHLGPNRRRQGDRRHQRIPSRRLASFPMKERPVPRRPKPRLVSEDALRGCDLFTEVERGRLRLLAEGSESRLVSRGETLWDRGAPAREVCVVLSGSVQCRSGSAPKTWISDVVGAGGQCGLAACVQAKTHMSTAGANDRSQVVLVPGAVLRAMMAADCAFAVHVAETLAEEVRRARSVCEDLSLRTPLQRVAGFLAARVGLNGLVELDSSQTQLAGQLGTVREVVGRGLQRLEELGLVSRRGRVVRVLRRDDLVRLAAVPGA
jgi:CRP-like cAMP-binding protein